MTQLKIRAYYQYDGPSQKNPFGTKLAHDDVVHNLMLLESDFCHALDDNAKIEVTDEEYDREQIYLSIEAECPREKLISIIEHVLERAQLYGEII